MLCLSLSLYLTIHLSIYLYSNHSYFSELHPPQHVYLSLSLCLYIYPSIYLSSIYLYLTIPIFSELHPPQPVAAQQVCPGAERGDGQVQLVDHQSGRENRRKIVPPPRIQLGARYTAIFFLKCPMFC